MNLNLDTFLDECLCHEVQKASTPAWVKLQMKFESVIAARMLDGYNAKAKKAVTRAANMAGKGEPAYKIRNSIRSQMRNIYSKHQLARINKDIVRYFASDRSLAANEFKIDVTDKVSGIVLKGIDTIKKDAEIAIAFDLSDREIIRLIESQNAFAASNLFKAGLSAHVLDVVTKIVRDSGLSASEQKRRIKSEMAKALGLKEGSAALENTIPKNFKGTSKDYYTGLATTTLTRAQTMGRLNLFSQGDFKTYKIQAILDRRTSVICQQINGREFTVEQGEEQTTKVLGAKSSEELKKVAGWHRDLSGFGIEKPSDMRSGPESVTLNKQLSDAGLSMPPYHFRCRTTIRPVN